MKLRIAIPILVAASLLLIGGCATCEPVTPLFVGGDVTALINDQGVLIKSKPQGALRSVVLTHPGQSQCVVANEPFVLSIPKAIDMAKYALQIEECDTNAVTSGSSFFRITLIESCMPVLALKSKCKILNWYNPYRIPEIRVANSDLSQLILTPLLNDETEIIGYEIRLGDHTECGSPARKVWEAVRKSGRKPKVIRPNTTKTPRSIEMLCQGKTMFG